MRISVTGLGKRFHREWIFKDLTYEFNAGTTYAIIGPNGSGKSTLIQVLWGQLPASTGALTWHLENKDLRIEDFYKHFSVATSYMELIEEFTLLEMVTFHFSFKKVRGQLSIPDVMNILELNDSADKLISNFSSGMRQRLKLGLALLADTPVVFLDEPTTNLDQTSISWYLKRLAALPPDILLFIASNQEHEYPVTAEKINILAYKPVTQGRIQRYIA